MFCSNGLYFELIHSAIDFLDGGSFDEFLPWDQFFRLVLRGLSETPNRLGVDVTVESVAIPNDSHIRLAQSLYSRQRNTSQIYHSFHSLYEFGFLCEFFFQYHLRMLES